MKVKTHTKIIILDIVVIILSIGIIVLISSKRDSPIPETTPPVAYHPPEPVEKPEEETFPQEIPPVQKPTAKLFTYIEIIDSCGPYYDGTCVNIRSGPGTNFPAVIKVRNGVVLKTSGLQIEKDGSKWYKIVFDEWIRYPDRVAKEWYVSADLVRPFEHTGIEEIKGGETATSTKRIVVDRSEQMLYAYDGDEIFMKESISTGLELTPTPRGVFTIYKKTPSRYMQGPLPGVSSQYYDLPGVPWNLYFTNQGAVVHGAYWHDHFGKPWSHGCVNLPSEQAEKIYEWAELGTTVTVRD
jgi:lipoprotein-anchoring transpeptidase ErfK/SrfK